MTETIEHVFACARCKGEFAAPPDCRACLYCGSKRIKPKLIVTYRNGAIVRVSKHPLPRRKP
jgi:DNA-directed RNA polymerase subunit RPC12/RpoP